MFILLSRKMVQVVAGQSTLGSGHWTLLECIDGKVLLEIGTLCVLLGLVFEFYGATNCKGTFSGHLQSYKYPCHRKVRYYKLGLQ